MANGGLHKLDLALPSESRTPYLFEKFAGTYCHCHPNVGRDIVWGVDESGQKRIAGATAF